MDFLVFTWRIAIFTKLRPGQTLALNVIIARKVMIVRKLMIARKARIARKVRIVSQSVFPIYLGHFSLEGTEIWHDE